MSPLAILGVGAIGQLIGHQLAQAGDAPMLLGRELKPLCEGFTLTDLDGQRHCRQFGTGKLEQISLLILTVKAYQVQDALMAILPRLNDRCHILALHNGLGPHEAIAPLLGGRGLSLGSTSQGALRTGATDVTQTGTGLTQLGHLCGPVMAESLKTQLLMAIPRSEWVDDILTALWQKLAVNACINPLSALEQVTNGELAASRFQATITAIIDELIQVAASQGISLEQPTLSERVYEVIRLTAGNHSSMSQDLRHGRKTEIDAINGYLVGLGQRHGISTPTNLALLHAIKARETTG